MFYLCKPKNVFCEAARLWPEVRAGLRKKTISNFARKTTIPIRSLKAFLILVFLGKPKNVFWELFQRGCDIASITIFPFRKETCSDGNRTSTRSSSIVLPRSHWRCYHSKSAPFLSIIRLPIRIVR